MSWDGVLATIETHLTTAGASLNPKATDIRHGEPKAFSSSKPVIAYWYAGDRESQTGGNTFTRTNIEEGVRIQLYAPDTIRLRNKTDVTEQYLRAGVRAIKAALWGDASLGGNAIGLDLDGSETGWFEVSAVLARTVGFTAWIDLAEVDVIAP